MPVAGAGQPARSAGEGVRCRYPASESTISLVRVKTSVTLPKELLSRLDQVDKNRSALLERAAPAYLAHLGV